MFDDDGRVQDPRFTTWFLVSDSRSDHGVWTFIDTCIRVFAQYFTLTLTFDLLYDLTGAS